MAQKSSKNENDADEAESPSLHLFCFDSGIGLLTQIWMCFRVGTPGTVIAKFYKGKELERLKRIYDKAELRVLN